jgi:hypothetical protein
MAHNPNGNKKALLVKRRIRMNFGDPLVPVSVSIGRENDGLGFE